MRAIVVLVVTFVLAVTLCVPASCARDKEEDVTCDVAEVVAGAVEYNELARSGVALMKDGAYREAAKHFERALKIPLFEQPNFKLLPRLALAQFRAGDREKADATLERAELALSVLAGVVYCVEGEAGFELVYSTGHPVTSSQEANVAGRMCGAAYDGYYVRPTLESFVRDSELLQCFFDIREEIERSR